MRGIRAAMTSPDRQDREKAMTAFHQDLALCSGDHRTLRFAIADPSGVVVDLTGVQAVRWGCARLQANGAYVLPTSIVKTLADGIEIADAPGGIIEVMIDGADTAGLSKGRYQQMRLVLNVGGQAGVTGTILYYRYSLDGGATWYDTDAAIQLDGSTNQAFWGNWQPIPPMLRQSIDTQVALFGRDGDGTTVVELVDWFTLDIRGVDHTSAARLLPRQVTPAEIVDPAGTELRWFSPKDIADIVAAVLAS